MKAKAKQPRQVARTHIAMDYGAHSIKFSVGIFQNGRLKVSNAFIENLPIGAYENGMIKDTTAMSELIKKALKKHNVSEKRVIVTIESTEIIKREMSIPNVEESDRFDLITYEVSQYLPIDVNNYVLQYKVLRTEKAEDREVLQILLGAMPKIIVKAHFDTLKMAGLTPVVMDLHSNVLTKLVSLLRSQGPKNDAEVATKTTAFIDFGYERIDINIMEGDVNRFNRILRMGVSGVDSLLADSLKVPIEQVEEKRLKFSVDSMISLKKAYDAFKTLKEMHHYSDDDGIEINESNLTDENQQRVRAIQDAFDYLYLCLEEIDKVFKYYVSRGINMKIDQIVVYGGAALNKDFNRFIQDRLEIPCYLFDLSQFSTLQMKSKDDSAIKYVNTFGALIR